MTSFILYVLAVLILLACLLESNILNAIHGFVEYLQGKDIRHDYKGKDDAY